VIKEPVAGRTVSMNALVLTGQGFTVHVLLEIAWSEPLKRDSFMMHTLRNRKKGPE
jgi:hypothetical protein